MISLILLLGGCATGRLRIEVGDEGLLIKTFPSTGLPPSDN
jgi:hypothetical protein